MKESLDGMISRIKQTNSFWRRLEWWIFPFGIWFIFLKPSSYKPAGLFSITIYGSSTGTILDQELGQYLKWYFYSIGINDISIAPEQEYDPYRSKYFLTVYAFW